ncbi:MAG TPA: hypothetical protein DCG30_02560 [Ruminococcus sp.]|nr:hypothetical protein [Ruminococcus sp.]
MKTRLNLKNDSIIYILDIGSRTGGGEALFQLRTDLENMGYKAMIAFKDDNLNDMTIPDKFKKYVQNPDCICTFSDIRDSRKNCIVVPEVATTYLFRFKKIQMAVWWLSSNYYDGKCRYRNRPEGFFNELKKVYDIAGYIKRCLLRFVQYGKIRYPLENVVNISGYNHVDEILRKKYHLQPVLLIHSIGKDFLENKMSDEEARREREDNVLYNPKKPSKLMESLLQRNKFRYIPIINMNPDEMIALFRKSKLYLDFGPFPGPERLPKETVYNGMNVMVGKRNTATNYLDVRVPDRFKIDVSTPPEKVEKLIKYMLEHHKEIYHEFDDYRNMVENMEKTYYQQLEGIFGCDE